ncbi:hypothetical protein VTK26DRAFT_6452 [Humicola hyalothermophila]
MGLLFLCGPKFPSTSGSGRPIFSKLTGLDTLEFLRDRVMSVTVDACRRTCGSLHLVQKQHLLLPEIWIVPLQQIMCLSENMGHELLLRRDFCQNRAVYR